MTDFRDFLNGKPKAPPRPARRWNGGPFTDLESSYDDVVADFTDRPLMSHCSCEACQAGRLPELPEGMAEAFDAWQSYDRTDEDEDEGES